MQQPRLLPAADNGAAFGGALPPDASYTLVLAQDRASPLGPNRRSDNREDMSELHGRLLRMTVAHCLLREESLLTADTISVVFGVVTLRSS